MASERRPKKARRRDIVTTGVSRDSVSKYSVRLRLTFLAEMDAEEGQFLWGAKEKMISLVRIFLRTRSLASFAQKGTGGAENVSVSRARPRSSNYTLLPPSFCQSQEGERVSVSLASQHTQKDGNHHSDESFDYEGGMNELSEMMRSLVDVKATLNKASSRHYIAIGHW